MAIKITSREQALYIVGRCYCDECGELRVKTPTGAVCPKHKLVHGVTARELAAGPLAKSILTAPTAKEKPGKRWAIRGKEYIRIRKIENRRRPCEITVAVYRNYSRFSVAHFRRAVKVKTKGLK